MPISAAAIRADNLTSFVEICCENRIKLPRHGAYKSGAVKVLIAQAALVTTHAKPADAPNWSLARAAVVIKKTLIDDS